MVRIVGSRPTSERADCSRCKYCNCYGGNDADCLKRGDVSRSDVRADGCRDYRREDY